MTDLTSVFWLVVFTSDQIDTVFKTAKLDETQAIAITNVFSNFARRIFNIFTNKGHNIG